MLMIFGIQLKLVQSTSPIPGKLAASVLEADGSMRPDMFMWDPLSSMVQFDEQQLQQLLHDARRTQGGWQSMLLGVVDWVISVVQGVRGMFGGEYGGTLGFGQMGAMTATLSAVMSLVAGVLAAVVVWPLSVVTWGLRQGINKQIRTERDRVLDQVIGFFAQFEPA